MKLNILFFTLFLSCISQLNAQSATVRGFIYNQASGERMPYQKIRLISPLGTVYGAVSDVDGFFSIPKLNIGDYKLKINVAQFDSISQVVKIQRANQIIDIKIELVKNNEIKELDEVFATAEGKRKKTEIGISQIRLDKKGLERIPSVGAENDVVSALSVTPGVVTTGDQGGQLYVRGGTPIQNKILLDGMTIYTPFHSIGFFSIFETELIKNVDIYTGGFDAKYGGRISSVMDISYRDGNRKEFGGKVSISPFLAKVVVEGPLGQSKNGKPCNNSYIFSAKHSLLSTTSKTLYSSDRINNGNGLPFDFTDLYGKITFNSDGGSRFSVFGFNNVDKVNYTDLANLNWKQSGGGMNFVLIPSGSPVFIRGHINATRYGIEFEEDNLQPRSSSIGGGELGFDFTFFQKNEGQIDLGLSLNGFSTAYTTYNEAARKIEDNNFNFEFNSYISYKLIKGRFVFQPSFRLQSYLSLSQVSPEPRLGIKYNATEKLRLKFSGGKYSQNFTSASSDKDIINLFNGLLSAPTNFQSDFVHENGKVTAVKNALQYSWHAIGGLEYDINKYWSINLEGYIKIFTQLSNINQKKVYDDVIQFDYIPDYLKKDFIIESGKSYGADFLLKYSKDRWFFWGTYSYGYSYRWDGFERYHPVFDRRHNINVVATYLFGKNKDLELSTRWNLGSGLPYTPTAGGYQSETLNGGIMSNITNSNTSNVSLVYGDFNSQRLPYYHRLDITLKKNFEFKNKTKMEIIASVTNVYNRKNIFYQNRVTNQVVYQFPLLPSLGVSYKF